MQNKRLNASHNICTANLYLRPVCNVFSTLPNEPDCFHACVRECSIARKLRKAFDGVLEWIDDSQEKSFKDARCKQTTRFSKYYHINNCRSVRLTISLTIIDRKEETYRRSFRLSGMPAQQSPHRDQTQPDGKHWICFSSRNECFVPESSPFEQCSVRPCLES